MLETSALKLSMVANLQLMKPDYLIYPPIDTAPKFLSKLTFSIQKYNGWSLQGELLRFLHCIFCYRYTISLGVILHIGWILNKWFNGT